MLKWILPSVLLLALSVSALPLAAHADEPPSVHSVAAGLMCQCGCGMTVAVCQESMSCSIAGSIVQEIQGQIDEGKSKQEITESFVSVYGEEILSAPRKSGFGLMAWVTPFLAVGVGGAVAALAAWAWVRRRSTYSEATASATAAASPTEDLNLYEQRVDEDLRLLE